MDFAPVWREIRSFSVRAESLGQWIALAAVLWIAAGAAAPASATSLWDPNIRTAAELEAGESIDSTDGWFTFSDFQFDGVGFPPSALEEYLVQPQERGFKLILGFGDLFGPASLRMVYTATAAMSYDIDGAAITLVALFEALGVDPLVEVEWQADNGATMFTSATGPPTFPFDGVSTTFDPTMSLVVEQIVTLTNGAGIVKVENKFMHIERIVPEPTSGLLVGFGLGLAAVFGANRRVRA